MHSSSPVGLLLKLILLYCRSTRSPLSNWNTFRRLIWHVANADVTDDSHIVLSNIQPVNWYDITTAVGIQQIWLHLRQLHYVVLLMTPSVQSLYKILNFSSPARGTVYHISGIVSTEWHLSANYKWRQTARVAGSKILNDCKWLISNRSIRNTV